MEGRDFPPKCWFWGLQGEISPFLLGHRKEMFYSLFQSILIKNMEMGFVWLQYVVVLNRRIKFAMLDNNAGMAVNKYIC